MGVRRRSFTITRFRKEKHPEKQYTITIANLFDNQQTTNKKPLPVTRQMINGYRTNLGVKYDILLSRLYSFSDNNGCYQNWLSLNKKRGNLPVPVKILDVVKIFIHCENFCRGNQIVVQGKYHNDFCNAFFRFQQAEQSAYAVKLKKNLHSVTQWLTQCNTVNL